MQELVNLVNEMSPYLLLGFFLAGMMHAFIPGIIYSRYLGGRGLRSIVYGALLGVPLPLCSCGVIPTAMSLRHNGASKGATTSFLIATPETGVDSIIATYSLLGLPFAILRPIAALCNAILGGWLIDKFDNTPLPETTSQVKDQAECSCCSSHADHSSTFVSKVLDALRFGFVEMMQDIGRWLIIGLLVAGLITVFIPDSFFVIFRGNTQLSMLLVLCIAIPMYICATGSIPIAVALMLKGITPGSALVLLMAGPACNMASILVINKVMGRKTLMLYLISIITMSIFWGHVVDYILPSDWFTSGVLRATCCHDESTSWFHWICSAALTLLLINALIIQRHNHNHDHEHDHEHEHEHNNDNHEDNIDKCSINNSTINTYSTMRTYHIEGMNCNHCRTSAERAILSVEGVLSATVDLHSKEANVEGTASPEAICQAVDSLGFTCTPM